MFCNKNFAKNHEVQQYIAKYDSNRWNIGLRSKIDGGICELARHFRTRIGAKLINRASKISLIRRQRNHPNGRLQKRLNPWVPCPQLLRMF